jgi:hypothetical protein
MDREVLAARAVLCLALLAIKEAQEVVADAEPDSYSVKVVPEDQEAAQVAEAVDREECSEGAED